jgi:AcrR family transcriptional regulator
MPKGRPRQFDTDKALDAALFLFWRYGYEGTSLAALTRAMGINVTSLYGTFGDKRSLFKKALLRYLQRPASYLAKALDDPDPKRAIEKLFAGAINMVTNPKHPDGCMLVQGALAAGPAAAWVREDLAKHRRGAEALIRKRLERAVAQKDLPRSVDPAKVARFYATVLWGMSVQAAAGASRKDLEDIAAQTLKTWTVER